MRYVFLQCGRKFGKTEFTIYIMYMFAILFPGSQIYYIADTMKHGSELVWENGRLPRFFLTPKRRPDESDEELAKRKEIGQELHERYILKSNNSDMRVTFRNGSFIKVDGAENYANADGIEPSLMVYDEFKSHDPRFNEAMEPNLDVFEAPLLIVGTPPDLPGTYYEKIANSIKKMRDGAFHKRPSYMNPFLYPEGVNDPKFKKIIQKYLDRKDEDVLEREYFAEIVTSGSKSIFPTLELPAWDYENDCYIGHSRHVRPHKEMLMDIKRTPRDWDYYVSYDPGSVICFAVLIVVINKLSKDVYIMDEVYEKDQKYTSTRNIYPRAMDAYLAINSNEDDWHETYDSAAAWFANEVADLYGRGMTPSLKDLKKKEAKLGQIKDLMTFDKFKVSDRCIHTIDELVGYRKDKNGKIPKEDDHEIDNFRYILNANSYDFAELEKPKATDRERDRRLAIEDKLTRDKEESENDKEYLNRQYGQVLMGEEYE